MSKKLKIRLYQPSTWRGIIRITGTAAIALAALFEAHLQVKVLAIITAITGLLDGFIGILFDDNFEEKQT